MWKFILDWKEINPFRDAIYINTFAHLLNEGVPMRMTQLWSHFLKVTLAAWLTWLFWRASLPRAIIIVYTIYEIHYPIPLSMPEILIIRLYDVTALELWLKWMCTLLSRRIPARILNSFQTLFPSPFIGLIPVPCPLLSLCSDIQTLCFLQIAQHKFKMYRSEINGS